MPQVSNSPPKIWPLPIRNQIRQLYRGVGERAYSQTPKAKCAQSAPTNRTGGYQARLHLWLLWQSSGLGFRFLLWTGSDGLRLWRTQAGQYSSQACTMPRVKLQFSLGMGCSRRSVCVSAQTGRLTSNWRHDQRVPLHLAPRIGRNYHHPRNPSKQ